jgi:hypothetical protein
MTEAAAGNLEPNERVVALLAAHWGSISEEGWIARQVAGALATVADVHIITPDGNVPDTTVDSVFTVHQLGTPLSPSVELRRDLLVTAISETHRGAPPSISDEMAEVVDRGLVGPWQGATGVLATLHPELVLIVGHQQIGALTALDKYSPDLAMVLVALGSDLQSLTFPHFAGLFDRSRSVLTVTHTEYESVVNRYAGDKAHLIGAPLFANPSALTEPDASVGETEYVLALSDVDAGADHWEYELGQLLRMKFPDHPVAVSHTDALYTWHQGRLDKGPAVRRSSDRARLMAWARVTVDFRPGRLFAKRCIESLLYGTPIVVPDDSRAREHAERGRGGLWFADPAELTWCVEAILDPPTRASFSTQARDYAEPTFGSTDRFIERVLEACGLGAQVTGSLAG